jgi:hypothetical protein
MGAIFGAGFEIYNQATIDLFRNHKKKGKKGYNFFLKV